MWKLAMWLVSAVMADVEAQRLEILRQLSIGPRYGNDLVKASEGRLSRGTVYVTLSCMEDEGLIASELDPSPRVGATIAARRYSIGRAGQSA